MCVSLTRSRINGPTSSTTLQTHQTLSPLNLTSSPFSSKYESIVMDPSVSWADAKLVTLRAGIPAFQISYIIMIGQSGIIHPSLAYMKLSVPKHLVPAIVVQGGLNALPLNANQQHL